MADNKKRGTKDQPANTDRKPTNSSQNATEDRPNPSLATRIQNSASGLARNAFSSGPSSADTAHLLAADGSKAGAGGGPSSSSALAAAQQYKETSSPFPTSSSSAQDQSLYTPAETFRSSSSSSQQQGGFDLPAFTEADFASTYGADPLGPDNGFSASSTSKAKGKGKGKWEAEAEETQTPLIKESTTPWPDPVPSDGNAVVSLLSDQTFDPEFPPTADEPAELVDTELSLPSLTPTEIEMIESFRRHMALPSDQPSAQQSQQPHRLTSFSLVPDIGSVLDSVPSAANVDATALRDAVLTSLPGAADWVAAEERYHDEVWGYLRPTLEAAAKEIESNKESGEVEEGPAVRRLKMVLRHMQA